MFELGIFCVILLAIGYWVALWLMGRHDDVLHGDFIHTEQGPDPAQAPEFLPASLPPAPLPQVRPGRSDSLQSLLTAIKRDLKDAAQI
ncbi:MAG: hypothetical protein ACLQDM_00045 [Bradyrhizobium sp.]